MFLPGNRWTFLTSNETGGCIDKFKFEIRPRLKNIQTCA